MIFSINCARHVFRQVAMPRKGLGWEAPMKCKLCSYTGDTMGQLARHIKEAHPEAAGWRGTKKGKRPQKTIAETNAASTLERPPRYEKLGFSSKKSEGKMNAEGNGSAAPSMTPLDVQQQFKGFLDRWSTGHSDATADFMAAQDAFEDPAEMARVLAVANVFAPKRRQVMEHWFTIWDKR